MEEMMTQLAAHSRLRCPSLSKDTYATVCGHAKWCALLSVESAPSSRQAANLEAAADEIFKSKVTCPCCKGTNTIRWGWADGRAARRVCLSHTSAWLVSPRYFCNDCHAAHRAEKLALLHTGRRATASDMDGVRYTFFCTPA
jgi:hypothetical protein